MECMTVRHFIEDNTAKVEVWVGSGQSDDQSAQVTIIDLAESGVEVNDLSVWFHLFDCVFCCPKSHWF